jgi:glycosyltransferase involved in cell wall biosynthesis
VNFQNWRGVEDPKFGYGSMLDGFRSALPKSVTLSPDASVDVYMGGPQFAGHWAEGAHRVCFTMWETTELPLSFSRWMSQYDQILVPCEHNVEVFGKHHGNVKHVPLGVDTKFWKPMPHERGDTFRFHAGGSLWARKGLDILVAAFNKLKLPNAELHIKAAPHARDVPTSFLGNNIYLHRKWMSLEEQREWYSMADCFVAPARGEGFGLMPLQSIAMGIPTIITATSGQDQYKDLATGVVKHKKSRAPMGGYWDEADVNDLAHLMKFHYEDDMRILALAGVSGAQEFSWTKSTKKLISAVPTGVLLDSPKKIEANLLVEIQVTKKCACEVNGKRIEFFPGQTYHVDENTHDIMYSGGYIKGAS